MIPIPSARRFLCTPAQTTNPGGCWARPVCLALVLLAVAGCPPLVQEPPVDGGGDDTGQRITGEPNNTFSQAIEILLDANETARVAGSIPTTDDVDVYRLGEFAAGDRIILDASTTGGLDADIALFDGGGRLIYENDDRNFDLNQLDPFVNHVIRHNTMVLYVGIASSPLNPTTGTYDVNITVSRDGEVPPTRPQVIILDADGGSANVSGDQYTVGPFDTADISASYAGMTNQVLDQIVATTQENYTGLQLTVLVSGRDLIPGGSCPGSTVLLGGTNPSAYGLAEQIDWYNEDLCDAAIVFTEMFKPFRFGRVLTAQELGTAIGNVVTHEIGHLLGLNHVANIHDIMDTTGTAASFLLDQDFTSSQLDSTIFPIGLQDGLLLLMETLGMTP